jgi:hypothetical protein
MLALKKDLNSDIFLEKIVKNECIIKRVGLFCGLYLLDKEMEATILHLISFFKIYTEDFTAN